MAATTTVETVADKALCVQAFHVISNTLEGAETPKLVRGQAGGLFVTWNKREPGTNEYDLRGCIGSLSEINVGRGVEYFASQAAFHDHRFSPISKRELADLQVGVSLLHSFEPAPGGVYDWQVGTHGIVLDLRANGRSYSATYLPDVMPEQRWSQKEAIDSLARKAGYRSPLSDDVIRNSSVTRYQSSKSAMTYQEFLEYGKER